MVKGSNRMLVHPHRKNLVMKAVLFFRDRKRFMAKLEKEIVGLNKVAKKHNKTLAMRLDGSSGLLAFWYNGYKIQTKYPDVKFYEYTKSLKLAIRGIENVDLTYSHITNRLEDTMTALTNNVRVAVAFWGTKEKVKAINSWKSFKVVDGDRHDYRFLDSNGVVISLYRKGVTNDALDRKFFEEIV